MGRQLDQRRPARLLPPAPEWRSSVRDLAADAARCRFQQQSTPALVRDEEFSRRAGAGGGGKLVKGAQHKIPAVHHTPEKQKGLTNGKTFIPVIADCCPDLREAPGREPGTARGQWQGSGRGRLQ